MTTVREEDRQMILAHVLCGREFDYKATLDKGLKRPPYLPGTSRLYDSVKVRRLFQKLGILAICVCACVCVHC